MFTPTTSEKCTCAHAHSRSRLFLEVGGCGGSGALHCDTISQRDAHPRVDLSTAVHDGSHDTRAAGPMSSHAQAGCRALSSENAV